MPSKIGMIKDILGEASPLVSTFKSPGNFGKFFSMCTGVLSACMSMHHMHAWCPRRPEKGVTRVTDGHEWLCGCWEAAARAHRC